MAIGTTTTSSSSATDPDRHDILNEVALRWNKLTKRDLIEITSNDQLVDAIVERYGTKKNAVQREVDMLMDGRNLGP